MEITIMGLNRDNGPEHRNYYNGVIWELVYSGYIGVIEKKMKTTITGLYRKLLYAILGLYKDNEAENGNY